MQLPPDVTDTICRLTQIAAKFLISTAIFSCSYFHSLKIDYGLPRLSRTVAGFVISDLDHWHGHTLGMDIKRCGLVCVHNFPLFPFLYLLQQAVTTPFVSSERSSLFALFFFTKVWFYGRVSTCAFHREKLFMINDRTSGIAKTHSLF